MIDVNTWDAELAAGDLWQRCEFRLGEGHRVTREIGDVYSRIIHADREYPSQAEFDAAVNRVLVRFPAVWDGVGWQFKRR